MNKNLKILIIGFGSIGQRHFKNLKSLGYKNVFVYDSDKKKILNLKSKILNLKSEIIEDFDVAFICNPNNKHIETALKCAEAGLHLFIEKPLSHNLKNIEKLEKLVQKKRLINMVACNMRFHPALDFIKKYIEGEKLGKIYGIDHSFGYYLPFWRSGTDYRQNYAAKKNMGGGIVLDDIHEFDLLFWLNDFNSVNKNYLIKNKTSDLKIETEDQAKAIFQFKNGILGSISCDYLSKSYNRKCFILGEKGNLAWDFKENIVYLETEKGRKAVFEKKKYDLNDMYIDEIKYFLKDAQEKKETFNNISRAKNLLSYLV